MSQMEIDRVLSQIRSLSTQVRPNAPQPAATQGSTPTDFATLMRQGIDQVNQSQQSATQLADAFARGTPGVAVDADALGRTCVERERIWARTRSISIWLMVDSVRQPVRRCPLRAGVRACSAGCAD